MLMQGGGEGCKGGGYEKEEGPGQGGRMMRRRRGARGGKGRVTYICVSTSSWQVDGRGPREPGGLLPRRGQTTFPTHTCLALQPDYPPFGWSGWSRSRATCCRDWPSHSLGQAWWPAPLPGLKGEGTSSSSGSRVARPETWRCLPGSPLFAAAS